MKIISWNINGIRAWHKKGAMDDLLSLNPEIFCLQETKAEPTQLSEAILAPKGYESYFNWSKERKGYSGTAIYVKTENNLFNRKDTNSKKASNLEPEKITHGLGVKELDGQGRQINIFFKDFVLINCYFPNGGGTSDKLLYKLKYYEEFLKFLKNLEKQGYNKIIICGDFNVAHEEIDLARPKENENQVGFLPEERLWIDELEEGKYFDTFRKLNSKTVRYSWWDMKTMARERNVGWRIDYFFASKNLENKIKKSEIHDQILGSDHCPISIELDL